MSLWCVSAMATKEKAVTHSAFMVEAESRYEALGKAMAIVHKALAQEEGWREYHVSAEPSTHILTPDMDVEATPGG